MHNINYITENYLKNTQITNIINSISSECKNAEDVQKLDVTFIPRNDTQPDFWLIKGKQINIDAPLNGVSLLRYFALTSKTRKNINSYIEVFNAIVLKISSLIPVSKSLFKTMAKSNFDIFHKILDLLPIEDIVKIRHISSEDKQIVTKYLINRINRNHIALKDLSIDNLSILIDLFGNQIHSLIYVDLRGLTLYKHEAQTIVQIFSNATHLLIDQAILDENIIKQFILFKNLVHLEIFNNQIDDSTVQEIAKLNSLSKLALSPSVISIISAISIEKLSQLTDLNVNHNLNQNRLTDFALQISRFKNLLRLDISHNSIDLDCCKQITQLSRLTHLNISHNRFDFNPFNGYGEYIEEITNLSNLQSLNISHHPVFHNGSFSKILKLVHLKEFYAANTQLRDFAYSPITVLQKLEVLDLSENPSLTLPNVEDLLTLNNLRKLNISKTLISCTKISNLIHLTELNISFRNLHFHGFFKYTFKMKNLIKLDISHNRFNELKGDLEDLDNISFDRINYPLPNGKLIELNLNKNGSCIKYPLNVFSRISHLLNLKTLKLSNSCIENSDWENLNKLSNLEVLDLSHYSPNSYDFFKIDIIHKISQLPNLKELDLSFCHIKNISFKALKNLHKLKVLKLSNNNVDNEGIEEIFNIVSLQILELNDNNIGNKNISNLSKLYKLTHLNLRNNKLTDIGVDRILKCPNTKFLKYLDLSENFIGREVVDLTKRELPDTEININCIE